MIDSNSHKTFRNLHVTGVICVLIIFAVATMVRLYPAENNLTSMLGEGDDWATYAHNALEIKNGGLLLPSIDDDYFLPAGFLYNYFVAGCFLLFGDNVLAVYLLQGIMLGLSVALIYSAFRKSMQLQTALLFLILLTVFGFLDVFKFYTFRLLSENLALFTISLFFLLQNQGFSKWSYRYLWMATACLGITVSVRPNVFPFAMVYMLIAGIFFIRQQKPAYVIISLIIFLLPASVLLYRNLMVTGHFIYFPAGGTGLAGKFWHGQGGSAGYLLKKILFCFGILTPIDEHYRWRPHWILMWAGYGIYWLGKRNHLRELTTAEVSGHFFVAAYYLVLILIAHIGNYGFRQLVPATFIVLAFSVQGYEWLVKRLWGRRLPGHN